METNFIVSRIQSNDLLFTFQYSIRLMSVFTVKSNRWSLGFDSGSRVTLNNGKKILSKICWKHCIFFSLCKLYKRKGGINDEDLISYFIDMWNLDKPANPWIIELISVKPISKPIPLILILSFDKSWSFGEK